MPAWNSGPANQLADPLVIGGREPAREAPPAGVAHFRLSRYATSAAMSSSLSGGFMRVMSAPGFSAGASAIQLARCVESLGNSPLAIVVRPATCVRFGPMIPGDTPWIGWQPRQALRAK